MKNAILELSKTARPIEPRDPNLITAQILATDSARESLLGIERQSKVKLEQQAARLRRDLKFMDTPYMRLSLEPLTWTRGYGAGIRPVFATYTLTDPVMTIRTRQAVQTSGGGFLAHGASVEGPGLPDQIAECYRKVHQTLGDRIKSTFVGIIPTEAKEAIKTATPLFSERIQGRPDIYIIAEGQWVVDKEPVPEQPRRWDPLVVGWDGMDLWLIAHFDLSSLEDYVIKEFPALPPGPEQLRLGKG